MNPKDQCDHIIIIFGGKLLFTFVGTVHVMDLVSDVD